MTSFAECKTSYISVWKKAFDYKSKSSRIDCISFNIGFACIYFVLIFASGFLSTFSFFFYGLEPWNEILANVLRGFSQIIRIVSFFFLVGTCVSSISLSVRRLRGMRRRLWWIILSFIPFVNLIFWVWLCVAPSKD